ncbi:hypothetical protein V8Q34_14825 [Blautia sp. JLR.GB0024]|uniref:hypothetical protein n=1 Tax=Blautia sp. JLR.GB0024 TaxID=3123295 RepID=UPI003003FED6
MADKRMFSKKMISSDAFLEMPLTAQGLFFHLAMRADDDGIVDSPRKIMRECQAKKRDLDILIQKRYVLTFPSGVILIKHWRIHNTIAKDRYVPTTYTEELSTVILKDNKSYTERKQNVGNIETDCIQSDSKTERSIDKIREDKNSKDINVHSGEMHDTENPSLNQFFESIWKLYPIKKGKGQVSKTKKQVLQRIGYEQIKRCVERYVTEIRSSGKEKYMMHGSTFFNSGYVDYLDENYVDGEQSAVPIKKNESEEDRFSCLEPDIRALLENCGVIDGQSLDLGNATDEQIKYLQECGVL